MINCLSIGFFFKEKKTKTKNKKSNIFHMENSHHGYWQTENISFHNKSIWAAKCIWNRLCYVYGLTGTRPV